MAELIQDPETESRCAYACGSYSDVEAAAQHAARQPQRRTSYLYAAISAWLSLQRAVSA